MRLQMYCKEFPERHEHERWCGTIVRIDDETKTGEILDVMFALSCAELQEWFNEYQQGINTK